MPNQVVWLTGEDIEKLNLEEDEWHKLEISSDGLVKVDNELWGAYDWRYQ